MDIKRGNLNEKKASVDVRAASIDEAVTAMAAHFLTVPQNCSHTITCFLKDRSLPDANTSLQANYTYGFAEGFIFAVKEILSGRLQLQMMEIDKTETTEQ